MQHWPESRILSRLGLLLAVLALGILAVQVAHADSITVTTELDTVDANGGACFNLEPVHLPGPDGEVSLREALCAANTITSSDTIVLPAGTYIITQAGAGEDGNAVGDLDILVKGGDLTISGWSQDSTIIDGNGAAIGDRVLDIPPSAGNPITVSISGVTLQHGSVPGGLGGGLYVDMAHNVHIQNSTIYSNTAQNGGGIWTRLANIEIVESTLSANKAIQEGGGIYHGVGSGKITVYEGNIHDNQAAWSGGGIHNEEGAGKVTISNSWIWQNLATSANEVHGGAIYNWDGEIDISLSALFGNKAVCTGTNAGAGGAIYHRDGTLNINSSDVLSNTASGPLSASIGGAISLREGDVSITFSTLAGNVAADTAGDASYGGAMSCDSAAVTITHSLISANRSGGSGGGLDLNDGRLVMTNTTLSGNQAVNSGGGIYNPQATVQLDHVTVTDNVADSDGDEIGSGGGILNNIGVLELKNMILAGNVDSSPTPANKYPDCFGKTRSHGNNLIGDQNGCATTPWQGSDQVGGNGSPVIDPLLHPLADNGGQSHTHAPRPGSPAVDAATCTDIGGKTIWYDQRLWERPIGAGCDIGAHEAAPRLDITKTVTPATNVPYHGVVTYTIVVSNSGNLSASSVSISDTLPGKVAFGRWLPGGQPAGATVTGDVLTWTGAVPTGQKIVFAFAVTHTGDFGDVVTNTAMFDYAHGSRWAEATFSVTQGFGVYLPVVLKDSKP